MRLLLGLICLAASLSPALLANECAQNLTTPTTAKYATEIKPLFQQIKASFADEGPTDYGHLAQQLQRFYDTSKTFLHLAKENHETKTYWQEVSIALSLDHLNFFIPIFNAQDQIMKAIKAALKAHEQFAYIINGASCYTPATVNTGEECLQQLETALKILEQSSAMIVAWTMGNGTKFRVAQNPDQFFKYLEEGSIVINQVFSTEDLGEYLDEIYFKFNSNLIKKYESLKEFHNYDIHSWNRKIRVAIKETQDRLNVIRHLVK